MVYTDIASAVRGGRRGDEVTSQTQAIQSIATRYS